MVDQVPISDQGSVPNKHGRKHTSTLFPRISVRSAQVSDVHTLSRKDTARLHVNSHPNAHIASSVHQILEEGASRVFIARRHRGLRARGFAALLLHAYPRLYSLASCRQHALPRWPGSWLTSLASRKQRCQELFLGFQLGLFHHRSLRLRSHALHHLCARRRELDHCVVVGNRAQLLFMTWERSKDRIGDEIINQIRVVRAHRNEEFVERGELPSKQERTPTSAGGEV